MTLKGGGWAKKLRRLGVLGLFALVASVLWQLQEGRFGQQYTWMGVPAQQGIHPLTFNRALRNKGFMAGWSDIRVNALWVSYRVAPVSEGTRIGSRPDFSSDWRTLWPITPGSYRNSGYDRGHLAPNYAIAAVHGREAQVDTFLMSNMSPQTPALNRQLWQRLEQSIMDHFARRLGELQIITGPVFAEGFLKGALNRVGMIEVPEAFYKIIVVPDETRPRALAFIMPQQVQGNEPLDEFLVSIDEVESRTGLDFFPDLTLDVQERLESAIDTTGWALAEVSSRPGRFQ